MSDPPAIAILPETTPQRNSGLATKVIRGTLWSLSAQAAVLMGSFIATPFVIRLLGTEGYGTLSLINVLIGYLAFSEIGMGMASTRFGGDAHARGNDKEEAAAIWTALLVGGVPALVISLALVFLAPVLVRKVSGFPFSLQASAALALQFGIAAFCFRTVSGVLNTAQVVRIRMDLVTLLTHGTALAQVIATPVVLWLGGGLPGALAASAALAFMAAILNFVFSSHLLPEMRWPQLEPALVKPLLRFGGGVLFSTFAQMVLANGEKLLLAHYASVKALAHYTVAFTLALLLTQIPVALSQPLLSAFSRLQATSKDKLEVLYRSAIRVAFFSVAPIAVVICVLARPFFTVWAGPEFGQESTLPLYILMVGSVFSVLAYIPYCLLLALGRTDLIARCHIIEVTPYLVTAALLTRAYGLIGAAVVWSLRAVASTIAFLLIVRYASKFKSSAIKEFRWANVVALATLIPVLIVMLVEANYAIRIPVMLVSLLAYFGIVATKVLRLEERALLLGLLPFKSFGR